MRRLLSRLIAIAFLPGALAAQARVSGYVFDSLRTKRILVDAQVVIVELNRYAATDVSGHFQFTEPVPAGTWTITFLHPVLDSLLTAAPMSALVITDSTARTVHLNTPSPATFMARVCPNTETVTGVLVGQVREVGTNRPRAGAKVATDWAEVEFATGTLRRVGRSTQTQTDVAGNYILCGIPTDISSEVHAEVDSTATGPVEIFFGPSPVLRRDFLLNPRNAITAALSGTVRDMRGERAANATVAIGADLATTRTDAQGHFAFEAAPAGTQIVTARLIGARPAAVSADLVPGEANVVDINLRTSAATQLPTVAITGELPGKARFAEFGERQRRGTGFYLSEEQIGRHALADLTEVLRSAPGLTPITRGSRTVYAMRGTRADLCTPTYYLDGALWYDPPGAIRGSADPLTDLAALVRPENLRGVEVYRSLGSIPPQYDRANGCGVVLFWTK